MQMPSPKERSYISAEWACSQGSLQATTRLDPGGACLVPLRIFAGIPKGPSVHVLFVWHDPEMAELINN